MIHLETLVRHGFAALRFVDATSETLGAPPGGASAAARRRIVSDPLDIELDDLPRRARTDERPGLLVFDFGDGEVVSGDGPPVLDDLDLAEIRGRSLRISGSVRDPRGLVHPRVFSKLDLAWGDVLDLALYPTPGGTTTSGAGEVYGRACLDEEGEAPAAWCTLALRIDIPPSRAYTFRAQADDRGEFRISLTGLPPLPRNIDSHDGRLTVELPPEDTDRRRGPDLDRFRKARVVLDPTADPVTFADPLPVAVRHGARRRIASPDREVLVVDRSP